MTRDDVHRELLDALGEIAPEADLAAVDPARPFRDQVDIDSMDFLNLVVALHERLGVDVAESDYPAMATIDGTVDVLVEALRRPPAAGAPGPAA
jgi:acyl carrier protein